MRALNKVLAAVGEGNYSAAGDGYSCRCPAHDDNSPSLTITPKLGKVLLHCHAGCTFEQIVSALGLQKSDTFDEETAAIPPSKKQKKRHATCDDAIAAVRWSVEQDGKEVVDVIPYPYVGGNSKPFGYSVRFNFADGSKTFRQVHVDGDAWISGAGSNPWPLYLLDEIPDDGVIYVHEGEKSADAGMRCGLPSIASKGGSKAATQTDWSPIAGRDVVILPDNDEAGEKFVAKVTTLLHALDPPATVKVVRLKARPPEGGDLADILEQYKEPELVKGAVEGTAAWEATVPFATAVAGNSAAQNVPAGAKPSITNEPRLLLQSLADVEVEDIKWLWKNRIAIGSLTVLTGPPGMTKSFLTVDLAARVSLGAKHPDGSGTCPQGKVIFFTMEDAPGEAIKPRLEACRGDADQVLYAHGMVDKPDDDADDARMIRLNTELDKLRRDIERVGNVKLLIFDPLEEYIRGDGNSSKDIRAVLTPLSKMARTLGIAIVAVHHINKRSKDVSAVQTVGGAGAWTQVPRTVLYVLNDPEDENVTFTRRRMVVVAKSNYGGTNEGQMYRLTDAEYPAVEWLPDVLKVDAEDVIRRSRSNDDGRKQRGQDKREAAYNDLRSIMLEHVRLPGQDINDRMEQLGHSTRQIRSAKKELGLIKHTRKNPRDPWEWSLPPDGAS